MMAMMMWIRVQNWLRRQEGQALSEYGVVLALILMAVVGTIGVFGEELNKVFNNIIKGITG